MTSRTPYPSLDLSVNNQQADRTLTDTAPDPEFVIKRKPCPVPKYPPDADSHISVNSSFLHESQSSSMPQSRRTPDTGTPSEVRESSVKMKTDGRGKASSKHPSSRWQLLVSWWSRLLTDRWILEIFAALTSLVAMASVFGVLLAYNGKPVPALARGVTLNAIIALLATASRVSIMLCVGSAISQRKWLWFGVKERQRSLQTGNRNLQDLETIENASRGPLGSMLLVSSRCGGSITYLAAIVTIGALGFDTFIQQLLTTNDKAVAVQATGVNINSATNVSDTFSNDVSLIYPVSLDAQLTAATFADMSTDSNSTSQSQYGYRYTPDGSMILQTFFVNATSQPPPSLLTATCPGGNCVWPNYYTLDLCTECHDTSNTTVLKSLTPDASNATSLMLDKLANTTYQSINASFIWEVVPSFGSNVQFTTNISVMSDNETNVLETEGFYLHKIVWYLGNTIDKTFAQPENEIAHPFAGMDAPGNIFGYAEFDHDYQTWQPVLDKSLECALTYCVREYQRSVVQGSLVSKIVSTNYGANSILKNKYYWNVTAGGNVYSVSGTVAQQNTSLFALVTNLAGQSEYVFTTTCNYVSQEWQCPNSTTPQLDLSSIWTGIELSDDFPTVLKNLASVMGGWIQQYGTLSVPGKNFNIESLVVVRWPWIILPMAVVILGIVTLVLTIWQTEHQKMPLWKSSLFPLVYRCEHDNDDEHDDGVRADEFPDTNKNAAAATNLVSRFEEQAEATSATLSRDVSHRGLWKLRLTPED